MAIGIQNKPFVRKALTVYKSVAAVLLKDIKLLGFCIKMTEAHTRKQEIRLLPSQIDL